jgi:LEA14-like dessication related protein
MRKYGIWIIGGLATILYLKYKMASSLQYSFSGIDLGTGSILQPQILVNLSINNPTATSATINAVNATIYNNNIVLGTIDATYEQVIPGNATVILQLPVNLQLGGILTDISTQLKKTGTNFEIKGSVTADLITVPIDLNYTF